MTRNMDDLFRFLSRELPPDRPGHCLSDEDIAELIDGRTDKKRKRKMMSHISSCETCFDIYRTSSLIGNRSSHTRTRYFPVWSLAATLLIAAVSYLVFFRSNVPGIKTEDPRPQISEGPVHVKNEAVFERNDKTDQSRRKKGGEAVKVQEKDLFHAREEKPGESKETAESIKAKPAVSPARTDAGKSGRSPAGKGNVQGTAQSFGGPAAASTPQTPMGQVREIQAEPEERTSRDMEAAPEKKEGLVKRLAMADETAAGRRQDPRCFRRSGDRYVRNPRFLTGVPLSDISPGIISVSHPGDRPGFEKLPADESFIFEVLTDDSGNVRWACLQAGSAEKAFMVAHSLLSWNFSLPVPRPYRFQITLKLDRDGKLEVIEKK